MTIIEILKKVAKDADKIWREADKCDTEAVIQKLIREEEK
jgi:hypothetical protein